MVPKVATIISLFFLITAGQQIIVDESQYVDNPVPYPKPQNSLIAEFMTPKNTSTKFMFPIPDGQMNGCNDISWCNEKCLAVMQEPMKVICSGFCFCYKL